MKLVMSELQWADLHSFMDDPNERAAFLFADPPTNNALHVAETWPLTDEVDYALSSPIALELADEVRPRVIAHAHERGLAVVEAHSHYWPGARTRFSRYDLEGLADFAPHMLWRLPGRPYTSLVIGCESFDALTWRSAADVASLDSLEVGASRLEPTGLSLPLYLRLRGDEDV
jgi:hypothetical protein